jgi:SAM-dependent methyltransferase
MAGGDWSTSRDDVTASVWGAAAREKASSDKWKLLSWDTHPRVRAYINKTISGDANEDWLHFTKRRFCPKTVKCGLSLGCGWGQLEREAIHLNLCEYFDAYDVSPGAIATAEAEARKRQLEQRIRYFCADLNKVTFEPERYDMCFAGAILHHISDLEHLLDQVRTALRPGGLFVVIEYVGPPRFQWSDNVEGLMNRILVTIPKSHRVSLKDGVTVKGKVVRPSVEDVIKVDPSEAVRSQDIPGLISKNFEILYRADFGGTLLQFVLADIAGNFESNDEKDMALLDMIMVFEETLIEEKVIPSDFIFVISRRGSS